MTNEDLRQQQKESLKQQQLKEKFMQFQSLQQYIEQVEQHLELLNQQHAELEASKEALKEFSEVKIGPMLAPIVNGVFVTAEAKDNQYLLVNVGADIVIEKPVGQVIELLGEQQKETLERAAEVHKLLQEFHQQAAQIYKEVEDLQ